ncbi:PBP1A family penicillin-binding protein [Myxococcota bacterium]|nr:PBP1A family penicillin-binding protein [Myxococcota bacterium]
MRRRWLRSLLIRLSLVSTVAASSVAMAGLVLLYRVGQDLPRDLSAVRDYRPPSTCRIYARDGTLVDEFYLQRRIVVPLSSLPSHVPWALLAAEDLRFYQHGPVDLLGIGRALAANLRGGEVRQGGSSISQQVVKNLFLTSERSYKRKLREAILAWRLERELTKDQILELYLNLIYLGGGNYGIEAAARGYFGKSAADLGLAEVAMIAGLIPAPSRYSPYRSWDLAKDRQRLVLHRMIEAGFVDPDTAQTALEEPIVLRDRDALTPRQGGAYSDHVRQLVRRWFGDRFIFDEGLQVYTALDVDLQRRAEEVVRESLRDHRERQGPRPPGRALEEDAARAFLDQAPDLPRRPGEPEPLLPEPGACFTALVAPARGAPHAAAGPWRFRFSKAALATSVRAGPLSDDPRRTMAELLQPRRPVPVCLEQLAEGAAPGDAEADGVVGLDPRPWSEGAFVALEPQSGRVRALVGGYDTALEGFNHATQGRRQPGSSFKPFIYAAALARGDGQGHRVLDSPIAIGGWRPKNYGGKYGGATTYRNALARSYNAAAVRVGLDVGSEAVVALARALGIASPLRSDVTLLLGSSEVTPLELTAAYAGFAAGGRRVDPVFVERIADNRGRVLARAGRPLVRPGADGRVVLPGGPSDPALPEAAAYEVLDMMRQVVLAGTGRRADLQDRPVAGKTGTNSDYRDAWFVGLSPELAGGCWVGTNGPWSLGRDETGGRICAPVFHDVVGAWPASGHPFPVPDSIWLTPGDPASGLGDPRRFAPDGPLVARSRERLLPAR